MATELDGFEPAVPPAGAAWTWPVYRSVQNGPPVVLLHEALGLTREVLALARRVADDGFTVWLPVLAGAVPATTSAQQAGAALRLCVSREIHIFASGRTSPVVAPLRALAAYAAQAQAAERAGVIGMCLTGGFALGVATEASVAAAVAAQPSLPLATQLNRRAAGSYGLSRVDRETVRRRLRTGELEVYLTRFSEDRVCRKERERALVADLGPVGERLTLDVLPSADDNPYGFRSSEHSVLCLAPAAYPDGPAHERLEQTLRGVLDFMHTRLEPPPSPD